MAFNTSYGKTISMRWDFDTNLWKQIDRTLEAINQGDRFFLNHVEALLRMVNIPSFVGQKNSKDGVFDDVSKNYIKQLEKIDADMTESLKMHPKEKEQIIFNAGLRRFNAVMSLLDSRKMTPQRSEYSDLWASDKNEE